MADFSKFRSSIGGFHRGDVVDYIESISVEHSKEMRRMQDAGEKMEAEKSALQAELEQTKAALKTAEEELAQLREEDASLQQQVESLAQEAAELSQRAEEAEERARQAETCMMSEENDEDASEMETDEEAEECLPDKELEAYRRAEAMERNALVRAERLKNRLSLLCDSARTRYTDSGEELEALTQDLNSVLERMQDTIAELRVAFDETEEAFGTLEVEMN